MLLLSVPCPNCGRTFNMDRIEKHAKICEKSGIVPPRKTATDSKTSTAAAPAQQPPPSKPVPAAQKKQPAQSTTKSTSSSAENAKFCQSCGNKFETQDKFCTECGSKRGWSKHDRFRGFINHWLFSRYINTLHITYCSYKIEEFVQLNRKRELFFTSYIGRLLGW